MSSTRLLAAAFLGAAILVNFTSCGTGESENIAASYPTVAEMDRLDVQWGLQPRKARGGPRRSYQYTAPSGTGAGAAAAPAAPPSRETLNSPPPDAVLPPSQR